MSQSLCLEEVLLERGRGTTFSQHCNQAYGLEFSMAADTVGFVV